VFQIKTDRKQTKLKPSGKDIPMKLTLATLAAALVVATSASAMVPPASPALPRDTAVSTGIVFTHGDTSRIAADVALLPRDRTLQSEDVTAYTFTANSSVNEVPTGLR